MDETQIDRGSPRSADAWDVALGHSVCSQLETAMEREWLVTNGLGGYAMGSVSGATTRRYHGLLVAALRPPVARTVLVTQVDAQLTTSSDPAVELGTTEYADGTISPAGYVYLDDFALEGSIARFRYRLSGGIVLEKRVWMEHGHNTSYVRYHLTELPRLQHPQSEPEATLTLAPYCVYRDYHSHEHGASDWRFLLEARQGGCRVRAWAEATPCQLTAGPATVFEPVEEWYWHVFHRREHERGLDDTEDVYLPGRLRATLRAGDTLTLVASAETDLPPGFDTADHEQAGAEALERERRRADELLAHAAHARAAMHSGIALPGPPSGQLANHEEARPLAAHAAALSSAGAGDTPLDPIMARLVLAADQFIVARPLADADLAHAGRTVIAGYPWFTDWGRDTMIAVPGLTLPTGRPAVARELLRTFACFLDRGMLPNRFPDGGEALTDADYNTVDATLWFFVALDRYLAATGDESLLVELFPALDDVIRWHEQGTRFGIGVDARDGLLRAGAPGVQLTWMDAKVADWVVTPRRGKPVEINALWYNALALMEEWAPRLGRPAQPFAASRARAGNAFAERFWYAEGGYLYDVADVDGVDGANDATLRPNQVLAIAVRHSPVPDTQVRAALDVVERHLLTPLGLRTSAPEDPAFIGRYTGDQRARDAAYHQGTVWPWLIGPYLDARLRFARDVEEARSLRQQTLAPFRDHLMDAGIGSISEIAEGLAPFAPRGCIAQAWSVAEALRCWADLEV